MKFDFSILPFKQPQNVQNNQHHADTIIANVDNSFNSYTATVSTYVSIFNLWNEKLQSGIPGEFK